MSRRYDLVVLGGGTAGLVSSLWAAAIGARVALVEHDRLGGDCLWTGCVPSKSLLASARAAHRMRTAGELGLKPVEPSIDLGQVMARAEAVIARAGERDSAEYLEARGVEVVGGFGRFGGPGMIDVGERELGYAAALVATGSRPALPSVPGIDAVDALTTDSVWNLRELPARLAVVGGGASGVELGQAFARLGSRVEIVEAADRLLPGEDAEAGELLAAALGAEGVSVRTGAAVERAERGRLHLADGGTVEFDRVLVATGRRGATDGLGLERVGVETTTDGWVRVDPRLRTAAPGVFAAGDVLGGMLFTHVAGHQGITAAVNALLGLRRRWDPSAVPRVVYTDPEVACVGLREDRARDPVVLRHDYADSDRGLADARTSGLAKLVCDRRGRLLGATVAAPWAGESIAGLARRVAKGERVTDLAATVHPYPTYSEGPARAAEEWWTRRLRNLRTRRLLRLVLAARRALGAGSRSARRRP
jgi:pyruvate/2-oxoglutarate dehydrogenase complex dihydrolipoamide dehydrogenase (E3) component